MIENSIYFCNQLIIIILIVLFDKISKLVLLKVVYMFDSNPRNYLTLSYSKSKSYCWVFKLVVIFLIENWICLQFQGFERPYHFPANQNRFQGNLEKFVERKKTFIYLFRKTVGYPDKNRKQIINCSWVVAAATVEKIQKNTR